MEKKFKKYLFYILQFTDNARFMASSLSNVVNNLSEIIHIIKCNYKHDDKKCETYRIKYKYCNCFLEYADFKDDLVEYKCLYFNKTHQHKFEEKLKNDFLINTNFLTMVTISLFYYCKKVFLLTNIWMIEKNSMEHNYLKKKIFIVT